MSSFGVLRRVANGWTPMTGKVLLDTNIVVALFKDDPAVHQHLEQYPKVLTSAVVLGELYYGAQNSTRLDKHLRQINRFLTASHSARKRCRDGLRIRPDQERIANQGTSIPENDIWIAATARQHDLTLVSRDRHFAEVDNLRWEQW